jgi:thiol:disulfide interchange protein DsbD
MNAGGDARVLPTKSLGAVLLASTLFSAHAGGLPPAQPKLLPPEQAFRFSARALDPTTVEARFDVADGYYLYRDKLRFTVTPVAALTAALPPGKSKHDEFFGNVETYRGVVVVELALSSAAVGQTLTVHADSQGCADVGVCYPPNPQELRVVVPASGEKPGAFVEAGRKRWFK